MELNGASQDGPRVLHEISFEVKSGERVGIGEGLLLYHLRMPLTNVPGTVGRTGSGKARLAAPLYPPSQLIIPTELAHPSPTPVHPHRGQGLLRRPRHRLHQPARPALQDHHHPPIRASHPTPLTPTERTTHPAAQPELLSGTLRENLDPFGAHDDAVLNDALRAAGLFSLQGEGGEGRITLDSLIASGGGNLSVGQRQILALARAIVRQSKLLILDEGTVFLPHLQNLMIPCSDVCD